MARKKKSKEQDNAMESQESESQESVSDSESMPEKEVKKSTETDLKKIPSKMHKFHKGK